MAGRQKELEEMRDDPEETPANRQLAAKILHSKYNVAPVDKTHVVELDPNTSSPANPNETRGARKARQVGQPRQEFFPTPTAGDNAKAFLQGAGQGAMGVSRDLADAVTLGGASAYTDQLGLTSPQERKRDDAELQNTMAFQGLVGQKVANLGRGLGVGLASATVGPGAGAGWAANKVLAAGGQGLGAITRGMAGGGIAGGLYGGVDSAAHGGSLGEIGQRAAEDAGGGALIGGGAAMAGELAPLASSTFNAVKNSVGGKAREYLESRGAKVGPLIAGKGGPFDGIDLKDLSADAEGIGKAGRRGAIGVLEAKDAEFARNVSGPYGEQKRNIVSSGLGDEARQINPLVDKLDELEGSGKLLPGEAGTVGGIAKRYRKLGGPSQPPEGVTLHATEDKASGIVTITARRSGKDVGTLQFRDGSAGGGEAHVMDVGVDPLFRRKGLAASMYAKANEMATERGHDFRSGVVNESSTGVWDSMVKRGQANLRPSSAPEAGPHYRMKPHGTVAVTENDLNDIRQSLGRASDVGATGGQTVPKQELDDVRKMAKEMVDLGPYQRPNAEYHKGLTKYQGERESLSLPTDASPGPNAVDAPDVRESDVKTLARRLIAEGTPKGGIEGPGLKQFRATNPDLKANIDLPRILQEKQKLQFRFPGIPAALAAGALGAGGGAAGGLPGLAAGLGAGVLATNPSATAGRLLYGPAQLATQWGGQVPGTLPGFIPEIEQWIEEARQRRAKKGNQ